MQNDFSSPQPNAPLTPGAGPNPNPNPMPPQPAPYMSPNPNQAPVPPIQPMQPAMPQQAPIQPATPYKPPKAGGIAKTAIIFLLIFTTIGAGIVAFLFWQRSEDMSKKLAQVESELASKADCASANTPSDEEITDIIENYYHFLRITQLSSPAKALEYLEFKNFDGETNDNYTKTTIKYEKFRKAIHDNIGTDSLALDSDIYKNFKNTDGVLYYKADVKTRENMGYEDKVNSVKLIDIDTLHYEVTIETKQIENRNDTSSIGAESTNNYDVYFVRDSKGNIVLDKITQK